jgi:hypothetical protein
MSNLFYLFGGIFTSSIFILYKYPNICYSFLLNTNNLYNKINNYNYVKFSINYIYKAEYNENNFLIKGKELYRKKFYSKIYNDYNINNLDKTELYIVDYVLYNKEYRIICNTDSIKKLNTLERKNFNSNKILMAMEGKDDITSIINKYEGIYGDFHNNLSNRKLRVKDIIKDNDTNITNQITIIQSNGEIYIYQIDDEL